MTRKQKRLWLGAALLAVSLGATVLAETPTISWWTVDGGGATYSTGGQFTLGATLGQPDAGPAVGSMTGGNFELIGGFWPGITGVCECVGDMNADGRRDGRDIQRFVACLLAESQCPCADVNAAGGTTLADLPVFVNALLAGNNCP